MHRIPMTPTQRSRRNRSGTTMVEFAIVAPLLFLFFFAAFEFCRVAMIRHTVDNAVYEGCRVAIIPGGSAADARQKSQQILATLGLSRADITVTPATITRDTADITVRISVSLDDNSFVPNQFVAGKSIVRELTMQREGV
ncbi:TadE/TadG family type IV pilus assembly protein [Stieleria varia]|nr:TadE/TadG family type IV pilus assembly protein [Stieleria varia]